VALLVLSKNFGDFKDFSVKTAETRWWLKSAKTNQKD
jgi:hypothetical protein